MPGIVGLGTRVPRSAARDGRGAARRGACAIACSTGLRRASTAFVVNGSLERRLPHNLHVSFDGWKARRCSWHRRHRGVVRVRVQSGVRRRRTCSGIGAVGENAVASIRFGLGRSTTEAEIDYTIDKVATVVATCGARCSSLMTTKRITVAHSPDSDDAFMFYGLASGAVDTDGIDVDQVLADIETLNRAAFEGRYEVTAVSFHAYAHLIDRYALLPHGASMGDNYGPIVVARRPMVACSGVKGSRDRVPGTLTTAYLTLQLFEPDFEYVVMPFDEIQQAVLDGKVEAGLLIHEGQLTYQAKG